MYTCIHVYICHCLYILITDITKRSWLKFSSRDMKPVPSSPMRFLAGTETWGSSTSQDLDISPHACCADSSSPQISAILFGHFTIENNSLRDSPQNFKKTCAENLKRILARKIPYQDVVQRD